MCAKIRRMKIIGIPFNPFTPETLPFFALIYNRLGGTYVNLKSSTLIPVLNVKYYAWICVYMI